MHQIWNKKSITNGEISLYYSLVSCKQIRMVQSNYLSAHISGIAKSAVSLPE